MRKLFYILFAIIIISCREDKIKEQYDIYNEWRWEETYVDRKVPHKTSLGLDTTYYYSFQRNGTLQIKDIGKNVKSEEQFKITQDKLLTIGDFHYSYGIDNDKLTIQNIEGIISWTTIFKIEK